MSYTKFFLQLFICLILVKCKNETSDIKKTKLGNKFIMLHDAPGEKIKFGQVAYCSGTRWVDDSLVLSTDFRNNYLPFTMLEPKDISKENSAIDVMSYLSVGDSISTVVAMDSFSLISYKDSKSKNFVIVLKVDSVSDSGSSANYFDNIQNGVFYENSNRHFAKIPAQDTLLAYIDRIKAGLNMEALESGLSYFKLNEGIGENIGKENYVLFDVVIMFEDKSLFMNSFANFQWNYVNNSTISTIPGLHKILENCKEGAEIIGFIPFSMAYGEDGGGNVPPRSNLYIYVKIHKTIPYKLSEYKRKYNKL